MSLDIDDTVRGLWHAVGATLLVTVVGLITIFVFAPKKVDGYYLSNARNDGAVMATCVWAHWSWHADEQAFCTNDYQEAVDFMTKATAGLKGQQ